MRWVAIYGSSSHQERSTASCGRTVIGCHGFPSPELGCIGVPAKTFSRLTVTPKPAPQQQLRRRALKPPGHNAGENSNPLARSGFFRADSRVCVCSAGTDSSPSYPQGIPSSIPSVPTVTYLSASQQWVCSFHIILCIVIRRTLAKLRRAAGLGKYGEKRRVKDPD